MKNLFTFIFLIIAIVLLTDSCDDSQSTAQINSSTGPMNGYLVIAGGNLSDSSVYHKFMELAGGPDAPIIIITTALTDEDLANQNFYPDQQKFFEGHGFRNLQFLHTRNRDTANSEKFIQHIRQASAVWFMGGRQWRLVDAYAGTKTLEAFNELLKRGGVIGGSSAGATIQGSFLARGDTKTNTVMMGDHEEGFGFVTNVAIDQHLLAMNRQFDIFEILNTHPGMLGLGLDENTAIIVHKNEFEVMGPSYVAVYDGTFYREVRDNDDWSHVIGKVTILPPGSREFYLLKHGQRYNLEQRKVIQE